MAHPNRPRVQSGSGGNKWREDEMHTLLILNREFDLSNDEILVLFNHLFDARLRDERRNYDGTHLRDFFNHRFSDGRTQKWRVVDRPNGFNNTAFSQEEVTEITRLRGEIQNAARTLGIQLPARTTPLAPPKIGREGQTLIRKLQRQRNAGRQATVAVGGSGAAMPSGPALMQTANSYPAQTLPANVLPQFSLPPPAIPGSLFLQQGDLTSVSINSANTATMQISNPMANTSPYAVAGRQHVVSRDSSEDVEMKDAEEEKCLTDYEMSNINSASCPALNLAPGSKTSTQAPGYSSTNNASGPGMMAPLPRPSSSITGAMGQPSAFPTTAEISTTLPTTIQEGEPLRMIHTKDLTLNNGRAVFNGTGKEMFVTDSNVLNYGGQVTRVFFHSSLYDVMVCTKSICSKCNRSHRKPKKQQASPTKGMPLVHMTQLENVDGKVVFVPGQGDEIPEGISEVLEEEEVVFKDPLRTGKDWSMRNVKVCIPQNCEYCESMQEESGDVQWVTAPEI